MATYSVITIGGTTIASGMTKKEADALKIAKCEELDAPYYYEVCEDETSKRIAESIAASEAEETSNESASAEPAYSYEELSAAERAENKRNAWQNDTRYGYAEEELQEDRKDNTPEHKSDY